MASNNIFIGLEKIIEEEIPSDIAHILMESGFDTNLNIYTIPIHMNVAEFVPNVKQMTNDERRNDERKKNINSIIRNTPIQ